MNDAKHEPATDRRRFLRTLGTGLAAAPLAGTLATARTAFADDLDALALPGHTAATLPVLREAYLLDPGVVYLNHASIGTVPRAVHEAHRRYLALCETNPWLYMWGGAWDETKEEVRAKAAGLLGATPDEVAILHNTTEAFNTLAHGLPLGPGDEVVFSTLNHIGASAAFVHAAEARGYTVRQFDFPLDAVPRMTEADVLDLYDRHLTPATKLLVLPHMDNTVGLRHPVRALARLARSRSDAFIAVDGAQTVGMIPVDVEALEVDVYATSPHKWLQAPKGLGLATFSPRIQEVLRPMWVTWGQDRAAWHQTARRYEDYGTRNLPEVLALGDAIDFQRALDPAEREARLRRLWEVASGCAADSDDIRWHSPETWDAGGSLFAVEVVGRRSDHLFDALYREHGFVFRAFHSDTFNTARISPNVFTTEEEVERFFALATQ